MPVQEYWKYKQRLKNTTGGKRHPDSPVNGISLRITKRDNVMKKIAVVHRGKVIIIIIIIIKYYKALCSTLVGWFSIAVIGAFRSSLFRWVVLSAVRFFAALRLLCFLIVGQPCFRNFNSTIPVDVVREKSYVNRLFDPACVPMRITINKLYLISKRVVSGVVGVLCNGGGLGTGESDVSVILFILSCIGLPVSPM